MKRRQFIARSAVGAVAALGPQWIGSAAAPARKARVVQEPARKIPLDAEADVIVCGAGPAGVAAAIAAARKGAQTILLEVHGCLGGVWTAGALSWILDYQNKAGLMPEILRGLTERADEASPGRGIPPTLTTRRS